MSQYIFSLLVFVVNNRDQFLTNWGIHSINTRHGSNLHLPLENLDVYQKGVYYSGIKILNSRPSSTNKFYNNPKTFKMVKKFLYINSFYSLDEYYNNNSNKSVLDLLDL
jgi:hypothetical protein